MIGWVVMVSAVILLPPQCRGLHWLLQAKSLVAAERN